METGKLIRVCVGNVIDNGHYDSYWNTNVNEFYIDKHAGKTKRIWWSNVEIFCIHFFKTCIDQKKMQYIRDKMTENWFVPFILNYKTMNAFLISIFLTETTFTLHFPMLVTLGTREIDISHCAKLPKSWLHQCFYKWNWKKYWIVRYSYCYRYNDYPP